MALDFKPVSQRKWTRGLQATFSRFAQPDQILTRLVNMVYTKRGGLRTVDGSLIFAKRNGALQPADGPILDLTLFKPTGVTPYYVGIQGGVPSSTIGLVTGLAGAAATIQQTIATIFRVSGEATSKGTNANLGFARNSPLPFLQGNVTIAGTVAFDRTFDASIIDTIFHNITGWAYSYPDAGSDTTETPAAATLTIAAGLPTGDYVFDVTACDGSGGETPGTGAPITVHVTGAANQGITLTWDAVPGAAGYCVYLISGPVGVTAGRINPTPLVLVPADTSPNFTFLGHTNTPAATPPAGNTTTASVLWKMDSPSYNTKLGTLPGALIIAQPPPPGGAVGGGSIPAGQDPNATTQGGVLGKLCPTPQLLSYQGALIIAPGNGYPPQYYTDGGSVQQIPNNFTAIYPDWEASTVFSASDIIVDSVSGGVFQATQGGETGASRPIFNDTLKAATADNTVVWQCIATSYQGQPLRGAAHAIIYAGFLFIANTSPTLTSDQQDGPSALKQCDLGNFKSWNPVNTAMVNQDDGDQITGLATFTIAELGISPTGNLVIFKTFSTFQMTGVFGGSDFSIQQSKTDLGCIASRSIQFLAGFGQIARLTHEGFAMFDGTNDKVFSEEVRPYIFGPDDEESDIVGLDWSRIYFSKAAQSSNPPMYVCACPILAASLTGVNAIRSGAGTQSLYVKFTKLVDIGNGQYEETAISDEIEIDSTDGLGIKASTPAAATGVRYRVYVGFASSQENVYAEADHFDIGTTLLLAAMNDGTPSLGAGALTRIFGFDLVQKTWTIIDLPFPISALKQIRTGGTQPLTVCGDWRDAALRRLFAGDPDWDGAPIQFAMEGGELYQQGGSGKIFFRKVIVRGSSATYIKLGVTANVQGKPGAVKTAWQNQLGPDEFAATMDLVVDGMNANIAISGQGKCSIDSVDWYVKPKPPGAPVSAQKT